MSSRVAGSLLYSASAAAHEVTAPQNSFPDALSGTMCAVSEPTVFENYVHDLYVDDQLVELSLWDTAGAS